MARTDKVEQLTIVVPVGEREKIKAFAEKSYPVYADYIRELIENDMRSKGVEINLDVDRGGDRRTEEQKAS